MRMFIPIPLDGVFAVIWKHLRKKAIETMVDYDMHLKSHLNIDGHFVDVKTIMAIPDYRKFLKGCIDSRLGQLHKELQTQHQWRFEAVEPSVLFPLGCKTTLKAYSSDKITEIRIKPKSLCTTPIGKATGFEPHMVCNTWQPEPYGLNSIANRQGTEGYFLLKSIPNKSMEPMILKEGSSADILEVRDFVREKYVAGVSDHNDRVRSIWTEWYDDYAPESDDVDAYVQKLRTRRKPFCNPLSVMIFNPEMFVTNVQWAPALGDSIVNPGFEYPEILQAAMNSVMHEMVSHPRFSVERDELLVQQLIYFETNCLPYYNALGTVDFSKPMLLQILRRMVGYSGKFPAFGGGKKQIAKQILMWGTTFVGTLFRQLSSNHLFLVKHNMSFVIDCVQTGETVIVTSPGYEITRTAIKTFSKGALILELILIIK